MKNSRKLIVLAIVGVFALSALTGCGSQKNEFAKGSPNKVDKINPDTTIVGKGESKPSHKLDTDKELPSDGENSEYNPLDGVEVTEANAKLSSIINDARSTEDNEAFVPVVSDKQDLADLIFEIVGVKSEDMQEYAISVSPMNIKAYGVAIIKPLENHEYAVKDGLTKFVETQKSSFDQYLPDQYDIADKAKVEKIGDYYVLVMCEDSENVYTSIESALK